MANFFENDVEKLEYHLAMLLDTEENHPAENINPSKISRILEMMEMCGSRTETDDMDEFAEHFNDRYQVGLNTWHYKKNRYVSGFFKIAACFALFVLLFCGTEFIAVNAFDFSIVQSVCEWGESIQKYVDKIDEGDKAMQESLKPVEDGKIILPQIEIDMAKEFYMISGYEEMEAESLAIQYTKEINALYQEALANGYAVSDQEIQEYLEELKKLYQEAENKEEVYSFMDRFESEQAYWDFQFEVYKKNLPIQKYNAAGEREFMEEQGVSGSTDEVESQDRWADEFEKRKAEAVGKYEFVVK